MAPLGTPPIPGFLSMGIGSWTNPLVFPGVEDLRWNCGSYTYSDGCTLLMNSEFFYGVTTIGGDPAYEFNSGGVGSMLDRVFIDQSDSVRLKNQTLLRNIGYFSDHFLNLNAP